MLTLKMPLFMLLLFGNKVVFQEWSDSVFCVCVFWVGCWWVFFFLERRCYLEYICLHLAVSDFAVVETVCVVMGTGEPEVRDRRL